MRESITYRFNRFFLQSFFTSFFCFAFFIFLMAVSLPAAAESARFWNEHARGWHWYENPVQENLDDATQIESSDPVQIMESLHQQIKRSLDQAILNPTFSNVSNYIRLQNQISTQAHRFATAWQAVLLNYPALDYSLSHPTNSVGNQVFLNQQKAEEDKAITLLAKHSGLFFFYRSTCPYCQRFAPIVKNFSDRYGISVVAITTDGIALPEFPNSQRDQGQAARFKVDVEPALFTVNPYSQQIAPVGYGLMSEDELRIRILTIVTQTQSVLSQP